LFENYQLVQWAYAQEPFKVIWGVRNDGTALSLTYIKEQEVQGWSRHDTDGLFYGVCSIVEPPVNAVYWVVKRYINGNWYYYKERFDNRLWETVEDSFCVDAGLSYPMTYPNATLTASAADGTNNITSTTLVYGGTGYTNPTFTAQDSTGVGTGATFTGTLSGGVITGVIPVADGQNYTAGQTSIIVTDPTGSGAIVNPVITNYVTFTASSSVFNSGMVGNVIRSGGGQATIVQYLSGTQVVANITRPITATIPNDPNDMPVPQTSGNWSISVPTMTVTGLNHLIGKSVAIVADGSVINSQTVTAFSDGTVGVTLQQPASAITVGLPFLPQLQSLYLDPPSQSTTQTKRKSISAVAIRVEKTRGISVGTNQPDQSTQPYGGNPIWTGMTELKMRNSLIQAGQPIPLESDDFYLSVQGTWSEKSQVAIQQNYPIPANISAVITYYNQGDSSG
jgi:hypothetical protein